MESIHKNHRKRVRNRFLKEGLDNFADHEVLELLLFSTIPRRDTNVTAHHLINRFGSLVNVLEAPYEELLKVDGVSEACATQLKLILKISSRYNIEKLNAPPVYDNITLIGELCVWKYYSETEEYLSILLFNNKMNLVGFEVVSKGASSSVTVNPEYIGQLIFKYNATQFILVHNHPGGHIAPSKEDITITKQISDIFEALGKILIEHIIIVDNRYLPMMKYLRDKGVDI